MFESISIQERVDFAKNLAVMLKSGISINEALGELAEQSNSRRFAEIITRVRVDVENGTPLSLSFAKEPRVFGGIFVSLIKAGEESGTLQNNLQFLADWLGRSADMRREIKAATTYPKLVLSAALLLGGSLAVFILPKLVPLFNSFSMELPVVTKLLLAASVWVQDYWLATIIGLLVGGFGLWFVGRFRFVKKRLHAFYLRVPFVGRMIVNYQCALITQLFGTLLHSGLSINDSVEIVTKSITHISYEDTLSEVGKSLVRGNTLSESMKQFRSIFPSMMISIVAVGESTGSLTQSFEYLADFYEKEVNVQTEKLPTVIGPVVLVFIALIVGFVALAIIMPIYELTGNIR